jgi:hypothetical protein
VTISPSPNVLGCVPESTARRVRINAALEKAKGKTAVSRIPLFCRGVSISNLPMDEDKLVMV